MPNPGWFWSLRRALLGPAVVLLLLPSCTGPTPSYQGAGYLIVAPEAVMPALGEFVDFKTAQGFRVDVEGLAGILAQSPGDDDPERIRTYLAEYASLGPEREFVLLVGSIDTLPIRMAYPKSYGHEETDGVPTDFYYEELTADWDADRDGFFGEYWDDMTLETESYEAEVYSGRVPFDEPAEVEAFLGRIIRYEEDETPRMDRALLAAPGINRPCDAAIPMALADKMLFSPSGLETTALYEDCPAANPDVELTRESFVAPWQALEPGFVFVFSHGTPYAVVLRDKVTPFLSTDYYPESVEPAVFASTGCSIGAPDLPEPGLGQVLVAEGACASFLGATRWTWYGANPLPVLLAGAEFLRSLVSERRCLGEAKKDFVDAYVRLERVPGNLPGPYFHQNLFLFMLYGDPSIRLR